MSSRAIKVATTFLFFAFIVATFSYAVRQGVMNLVEIKISMARSKKEVGQKPLYERVRADLSPIVNSYLGKPILSVDIEELLALVKKDPRVSFARVYRRLPNRLELEIFPRKAMMAILAQDGSLTPVSMDAEMLPKLSANEVGSLPILRGEVFLRSRKLRMKAMEFILSFPSAGKMSLETISEIHYKKNKGFKVLLVGDGTFVLFGHDQFKAKVSKVEKVLNYIRNKNLKGRVIDSRFSKKVVVRLRNGL